MESVMRAMLFLSLLTIASPALARDPGESSLPVGGKMGRALADPALPDQLGRAAAAMSRALMSINVGEVQAAIEDRPVSEADRRRTVGDMIGRADPDVDRGLQHEVASSTARMQHSAQAVARALPAIERALTAAAAQIDRATANLPDPDYPRR